MSSPLYGPRNIPWKYALWTSGYQNRHDKLSGRFYWPSMIDYYGLFTSGTYFSTMFSVIDKISETQQEETTFPYHRTHYQHQIGFCRLSLYNSLV